MSRLKLALPQEGQGGFKRMFEGDGWAGQKVPGQSQDYTNTVQTERLRETLRKEQVGPAYGCCVQIALFRPTAFSPANRHSVVCVHARSGLLRAVRRRRWRRSRSCERSTTARSSRRWRRGSHHAARCALGHLLRLRFPPSRCLLRATVPTVERSSRLNVLCVCARACVFCLFRAA